MSKRPSLSPHHVATPPPNILNDSSSLSWGVSVTMPIVFLNAHRIRLVGVFLAVRQSSLTDVFLD
jgi:hypothetical protein